ncbi:MAG TPA: YqhA family protein [Chitinophagaceae bacterium]|nr:YqhA family protein [Chitinophagaceae bacterium]
MKNIFGTLKIFIGVIAVLVLVSGIVLTALGAYDLVKVVIDTDYMDTEHLGKVMAIGLLSVVDLFLIAIVFFVLALGVMLLFIDPAKGFPVNLPNWLRIKNFMELKVILWEAILTTLVIAFLTGLAGKKINGEPIDIQVLIIPGGILLISLSLYFLKRGKHE